MVAAFMLVHTQWNVGGLGHRTGLRYESCLAMLERTLPDWQRRDPANFAELTVDDLMSGLQVIESAMLAADAERHAAERAQHEAQRMRK